MHACMAQKVSRCLRARAAHLRVAGVLAEAAVLIVFHEVPAPRRAARLQVDGHDPALVAVPARPREHPDVRCRRREDPRGLGEGAVLRHADG